MMVHMVLTITIMWCEIDESILEILFILFFFKFRKGHLIIIIIVIILSFC